MISAVKFGAKVFSEKKTSIFSEVAYVCILLTKVEENIKQFVMKLEHLVSTHCLSNSGDWLTHQGKFCDVISGSSFFHQGDIKETNRA